MRSLTDYEQKIMDFMNLREYTQCHQATLDRIKQRHDQTTYEPLRASLRNEWEEDLQSAIDRYADWASD